MMLAGQAWPRVRLGELLKIKHGFAFKGEYFSDEPGEVVLTPGNFAASGGLVFRPGKDRSYTGEFPAEFRLQEGDMLVVMTDLTQEARILGAPAFVPATPDCLHNQRLGKVVKLDERRLDRRFLYYVMNRFVFREALKATATGATVKHTAPGRIEAFEVELPPLATQRRIAGVLGTYDDLIEVNQRRIALIEEIAQRLFEEWFLRFRFPGHSGAETESISSARRDWHSGTVSDGLCLVRGRSYRSTELADTGGLPFVNLKCVKRDGGFRRDGLKRFTGDFKAEQALWPGDVVMAVTDMTQERRIVGQAALIPRLDEPHAVLSMDLVKVEPTARTRLPFLYFWLRFSGFSKIAAQHANGANVLHLSPKAVVGLPMVIPPIHLQEAFCEVAEPIMAQADVLAAAGDRLAASRDLLLPRLISGDLPVTVAEGELETAA
jgi:type I restriction enzyme S subunit